MANFSLYLMLLYFILPIHGDFDERIAVLDLVIENVFLAYRTAGGKLYTSSSPDSVKWSDWSPVNNTGTIPTLTSNPVVGYDFFAKKVVAFAQASDGQVYSFSRGSDNSYAVMKLSADIPAGLPPAHFSLDSVKTIDTYEYNMTHLFVRSQSNHSEVYYSFQDWKTGTWSKFTSIVKSNHFLAYDFDVVLNRFVWRLEVFVVTEDLHMRHTWQTSPTTFDGSWHDLVLFPPKFNAAPAAHSMGHSFFNGVVEVFGREGNTLHHIHQTTCDQVSNPWGPCTWDVAFHQMGELASDPRSANPLTVTNNVHLGLEVFVVNAKDNHLYHIWQPERGKGWSSWEDLGGSFSSQPCIVLDSYGWWDVYGVTGNSVTKLVQTPLDFAVSSDTVKFNENVTVTWKIPNDEATHKDWIGVYPSGSSNLKYVDFMYVGGSQNPLADPVPRGQLQFTAVLPNGKYDYRYLVNRQFVDVIHGSAEVTGATQDVEWVQLYKGISRGLGNLNKNFTACVKDGQHSIDAFNASFIAFEDREIIKGLQLFGTALMDVYDTLVQCEETDIAKKLEKFIGDLISCTESNCVSFVIDIGLEILVLYERIYEIYGDIYGAKNSFDIKAYEMGGICVGRVTWACLSLPDVD